MTEKDESTNAMSPERTKSRYRSGEAARLAGMPAATLRIWEQRYSAVAPPHPGSRQRTYSDEDLRRLKLLRKLVDSGDSIGAIARLPTDALEERLFGKVTDEPADRPTLALVAFPTPVTPGDQLEGMTITACAQNLAEAPAFLSGKSCDALFVTLIGLSEDAISAISDLAKLVGAKFVSVAYSFGNSRAIAIAHREKIRVHQTSQLQHELQGFLHALYADLTEYRSLNKTERGMWSRVPAQLDANALEVIASSRTGVNCECPKHLAELVMRLRAFERYSDACLSSSPADALLHRHLGNLANRAAELFEAALIEVCQEA